MSKFYSSMASLNVVQAEKSHRLRKQTAVGNLFLNWVFLLILVNAIGFSKIRQNHYLIHMLKHQQLQSNSLNQQQQVIYRIEFIIIKCFRANIFKFFYCYLYSVCGTNAIRRIFPLKKKFVICSQSSFVFSSI